MRTVLAILLAAFTASAFADANRACEKPWVFVDIGDTIVDTSTYDYNPMFYLEKVRAFEDGKRYRTARDYLEDLRAHGFTIGAIMDVPEEWGRNYPPSAPIEDFASAKILRTMDFIAGVVPGDDTRWIGTAMDWSPFGRFEGTGPARLFKGALLLPRDNSERKRSGSTILFERAKSMAQAAGCLAIYEGEAADEMPLAEKAGIPAFLVGKSDPKHFYLPIDKIVGYSRKKLR